MLVTTNFTLRSIKILCIAFCLTLVTACGGGSKNDSDPLIIPSSLKAITENLIVSLSWSSIEQALGYYVYRDTQAEFNQDTALQFEVSDPSFEDDTLETDTTYYYWVTAKYNEGESDLSSGLEIKLIPPVNKAPEFSLSSTLNIVENASSIVTLKAEDPDSDAISFSISGGADADLFEIDATTLQLQFVASPDAESPKDSDKNNVYQITLAATDTAGNTQELPVEITVDSVNEAPKFSLSSALNMAENTSSVVTLMAEDPESDAISFSISGGADADLFEIDAATQQLQFVASPDAESPKDSNADNVYQISLTATDTAGNIQELPVEITVNSVDEAPTFTGKSKFSIPENETFSTILLIEDPENKPITIEITASADGSLFSVDPDTKALSLNSPLDFENPLDTDKDNSYEINLTFSDGQYFKTHTFEIEVMAVNEFSPVFDSPTEFTIEENTTEHIQIEASDGDEQKINFSIVEQVDHSLFSINSESGELRFNEPADFENPLDDGQDNVYQLTIQADDGEKQTDQAISISIKNAEAKINAKLEPIIFSGDTIWIDAGLSVAGEIDDPIVSYQWNQIPSDSSPDIKIRNASQATGVFTAPEVAEDTAIGINLTATTAQGSQHKIDLYSIVKPYTGLDASPVSHEFPTRVLSKILESALYHDVELIENTAYVANQRGLQIIDASNKQAPVLLGRVITPGNASAIEIVGSVAYVADGWEGLQIIDVSDPDAPMVLGEIDLPGYAHSLAIENSIAYVANGAAGLQLVDVSDSHSPFLLSSFESSDHAMDVVIVDSIAYLANDSSGIEILDISDPMNPTSISNIDTLGEARGLTVLDSILYVANDNKGLQLVDISNVNNPKLKGSIETQDRAYGVSVVNSTAYVADYDGGLQLIDVSDVNTPQLIYSFDTPGIAYNVAIHDSIAYIADYSSGLQIIDVSELEAPVLLGNVSTSHFAMGVTDVDSIAYLADGDSGLHLIDINDAQAPVLLTSVDTPGSANAVTIENGLAYVADGSSGLQVIDISDTQAPNIISSIDLSGNAVDVTVANSIAYVADDEKGLQIFDVSDSQAPLHLSGALGKNVNSVMVSESFAYVAQGDKGLKIIDISDLQNPVEIGNITTSGTTKDVTVINEIAYVVDDNGLHLVNTSNKQIPELISSLPLPIGANSVTVIESIAYVADKNGGFQIIDVSNADTPFILGNADHSSDTVSVSLIGSIAYVASGLEGLHLVDVSNPQVSEILTNLDTPGFAQSIVVVDSVAFIADGDSGLQIIDISNRQFPTIIGQLDTPGQALDVAVADTVAYVADGTRGLQHIDVSNAREPIMFESIDLTSVNLADATIKAVAIANSILYTTFEFYDFRTGELTSGLLLIDVSDAQAPLVLNTHYLAEEELAQSVVVNNSMAFVTYKTVDEDEYGLYLIDISNPQAPSIANKINTPGMAYGVAVNNSIAYVSHETYIPNKPHASGMQLIDFTIPQTPRVISNVNILGLAQNISVLDSMAYVTTGHNGLTIIDVSDSQRPEVLDQINTLGYAADVSVLHNKAYIANHDKGLAILSLAELGNSYSFGIANESLLYQVNLDVQVPITELEGMCWVTGGTCNVQAIDNSNNSITYNWQIADSGGNHEIVFGIGTKDLFLTSKDHVSVIDALADSIAGTWQVSTTHSADLQVADYISVDENFGLVYFYKQFVGCSSTQSKLEQLQTNSNNQQTAQDGETRFVLSSDDELVLIHGLSGIANYSRVDAVGDGCL